MWVLIVPFAACASFACEALTQEPLHVATIDGPIALADGLVTLHLEPGDRFVADNEARSVLEGAWGNAWSEHVAGLFLPSGVEGEPPWAVVVSWHKDGWLSGGDRLPTEAALLDAMRAESNAAEDASAPRIVGWAMPPRWRGSEATLQWATRLQFPGDELATVNVHHVQALDVGWLELVLLCPVPAEAFLLGKLDAIADRLQVSEGARWQPHGGNLPPASRTASDLITGRGESRSNGAPVNQVAPQEPSRWRTWGLMLGAVVLALGLWRCYRSARRLAT